MSASFAVALVFCDALVEGFAADRERFRLDDPDVDEPDVDEATGFREEPFADFVAAPVVFAATGVLSEDSSIEPFAGARFAEPVRRPAWARRMDSAGSDGSFSPSTSWGSVCESASDRSLGGKNTSDGRPVS
ncbi:hypothetical protein FB108_0105 [Brevibacterium jeotgali]|nr:hypothetical protein FB108_0105 [Brevibacterium jeotgali]